MGWTRGLSKIPCNVHPKRQKVCRVGRFAELSSEAFLAKNAELFRSPKAVSMSLAA